MAKYYATISGLPNIGVDDRKLPFSSELFVEELREVLTSGDFKLLEVLRWERENRFLISGESIGGNRATSATFLRRGRYGDGCSQERYKAS